MGDKNNHRTTIQFYNNDITKKVRIVLEGMNEDGKLARIERDCCNRMMNYE